MSAGFWCADPAQAGVAFAAQDAVATSNAGRYGGDVNAAPILATDVASLAVQYSAASTTDGINLSVAAGSTTINRYASVLLLKGVTNAHVGAINLGTGTSAINVTNPGFRADLVLFLGAWAADETVSTSARFTFGAAKIDGADTVTQGCVALESRDNAAATDTSTAIHNDVAAAKILSTALGAEISVSANANGFTVTPSADSASNVLYYLALELPSPDDSYVGVVDTQTGTGNLAYDVTAFEPLALLLAGTMCTAVGTLTEAGSMHLGMGGPASAEWGTTFIDEDASDPTDNEGYADTSNILRIQSAVGSTDTIASLASLDADGWTLNYSDGSASARKMLAIAIGNSSSGGVTGTLSATESGSDTASISGDVLVKGALAATESGADSAALAGKVLVEGALSASESGADTAALAGDVLVKGALAASESGNDSASFIGEGFVPTATGTLAASESGSDTASIAGKVYIAGTLSAVEGGLDGFAASGNILVQGTLAASETGDDTAAFVQETLTLTPADLNAIAAAVWADPAAVAAHAKLDEIIARITC